MCRASASQSNHRGLGTSAAPCCSAAQTRFGSRAGRCSGGKPETHPRRTTCEPLFRARDRRSGGGRHRRRQCPLDVCRPFYGRDGPDRLQAVHQPEEESHESCVWRRNHKDLLIVIAHELESASCDYTTKIELRVALELAEGCFEAIAETVPPAGRERKYAAEN